jgi:hypothetical protein
MTWAVRHSLTTSERCWRSAIPRDEVYSSKVSFEVSRDQLRLVELSPIVMK